MKVETLRKLSQEISFFSKLSEIVQKKSITLCHGCSDRVGFLKQIPSMSEKLSKELQVETICKNCFNLSLARTKKWRKKPYVPKKRPQEWSTRCFNLLLHKPIKL